MTTTAALARCPVKGCAIRYAAGPDRECAEHKRDTGLGTAAQRLQAMMAAPGTPDLDGVDGVS